MRRLESRRRCGLGYLVKEDNSNQEETMAGLARTDLTTSQKVTLTAPRDILRFTSRRPLGVPGGRSSWLDGWRGGGKPDAVEERFDDVRLGDGG